MKFAFSGSILLILTINKSFQTIIVQIKFHVDNWLENLQMEIACTVALSKKE